ncbi:methyltransferase [Robbsia sp. Bb-Pol-6]|uniref:Chemotaxis protein methyltransferase n=1 Tax=Robbsia betulipollinis TaxID=2981849 RepID=A0ABT3ZHA8_9BURK|nr:methyltransferase [Robbsia betulipollinis]
MTSPVPPSGGPVLADHEFRQIQRFIQETAGITMNDAKKALVSGRLSKRLSVCGVQSYGAYLALLQSPDEADEVQQAIDVLTTNETYFFREQKHFDALRMVARDFAAASAREAGREGPRRLQPFRVWSAASSSGEEAYSIAMLLADTLPKNAWEVVGTDISSRMVLKARRGHYPDERARQIAPDYLKRFCLRGIEDYAGSFLIEPGLRERVAFHQLNLNAALPSLGRFDVIFLRNVMIYFSMETRRQVVERIVDVLRPGGYLYVGLSETLNGVTTALSVVAPSIYVKA